MKRPRVGREVVLAGGLASRGDRDVGLHRICRVACLRRPYSALTV